MTELHVTIDGVRYLMLTKKVGEDTVYSFDRGENWRVTQVEAFKIAREQNGLVQIDAAPSEAGEYEAFVYSLLQQIQELEVGETLKLTRMPESVVVLKENMVFAVRASTISEVDLRMEDRGE